MSRRRRRMPALVVAGSLGLAACAGAGHPLDGSFRAPRPEPTLRERDSLLCPVVLTNQTDEQLDAAYVVEGVQSMLGLIPAGRSLSFGVSCDAGRIEALGVSSLGFLGGGPEYRTRANVDRGGPTHLGFRLTDRIR